MTEPRRPAAGHMARGCCAVHLALLSAGFWLYATAGADNVGKVTQDAPPAINKHLRLY